MNIKESRIYTISDLLEWDNSNLLTFSPPYQRNSVWELKAKSYFIDTILHGYPIPALFMRSSVDSVTRKNYREIIDGQQRTRTILEFIENKFSILKSQSKDYAGLFYDDLTDEQKNNFLKFNLTFEIINSDSDAIIYDIFARLNSNNAVLNEQEKRNAEYHGSFKVFVYGMAKEIHETSNILDKMFTPKNKARMKDIEFLSNICILLDKGVTDETQSNTNKYYKENDRDFILQSTTEQKLRFYKDIITYLYEEKNDWNFFFKYQYIYTLIAALEKLDWFDNLIDDNNKLRIKKNALFYKLIELEAEMTQFDGDDVNLQRFMENHRIHTNQLQARNQRVSFLQGILTDV